MTSSWLATIGIGVILSFIWPPIGAVIDEFSEWATSGSRRSRSSSADSSSGCCCRFGLHHIWNAPFFFEMGDFTTHEGKR